MKIYRGVIVRRGGRTEKKDFIITNGRRYELPLYLDEVCHSPTGFNWGYVGSGPAQLAYAMLRDYGLTKEDVMTIYMAFKNDIIARFDVDGNFEITSNNIDRWLFSLETTMSRP